MQAVGAHFSTHSAEAGMAFCGKEGGTPLYLLLSE